MLFKLILIFFFKLFAIKEFPKIKFVEIELLFVVLFLVLIILLFEVEGEIHLLFPESKTFLLLDFEILKILVLKYLFILL